MIQFKTEQRQLQKTSKTPPNKGRGLQSTSISLKLDLSWQVGMRGRESWVTAESLDTLRNLLVSWFFEIRPHIVDQAGLSLQRACCLLPFFLFVSILPSLSEQTPATPLAEHAEVIVG